MGLFRRKGDDAIEVSRREMDEIYREYDEEFDGYKSSRKIISQSDSDKEPGDYDSRTGSKRIDPPHELEVEDTTEASTGEKQTRRFKFFW